MQAMTINAFGDPDLFQLSELPMPVLQPGHVLIEVKATSVNPVDCLLRGMGPEFAPELPAVLHGDVAGIVKAVAPDVREFSVGDAVYGCAGGVRGTPGGALAEYMLADAALLAPKPKTLSMREAAALPLVGITAWEGIFERARVGAGDSVLVQGGAGGVGHMALQLAKAAGASVYATASTPQKQALVRELGADGVIAYRDEAVESYVARLTGGQGFDVVFDTVGGGNLARSFAAARLNGKVVTTLALGSFDLSPVHLKGLSLEVIFMLIPLLHGVNQARYGVILRQLAELVDTGKLRPVLDSHAFHMSEVAAAHALLESGEATGKIVLAWD